MFLTCVPTTHSDDLAESRWNRQENERKKAEAKRRRHIRGWLLDFVYCVRNNEAFLTAENARWWYHWQLSDKSQGGAVRGIYLAHNKFNGLCPLRVCGVCSHGGKMYVSITYGTIGIAHGYFLVVISGKTIERVFQTPEVMDFKVVQEVMVMRAEYYNTFHILNKSGTHVLDEATTIKKLGLNKTELAAHFSDA